MKTPRPAVLFDMDGSTVVDQLFNGADDGVQKRLEGFHTRYYEASAALDRAGVPAQDAVFVGGVSRGELEHAGAAAVFDDAHVLCDNLATSAVGTLT